MAENNGSKRGRKPADFSPNALKAGIDHWLASDKADTSMLANYTITPIVKDAQGFVQNWEVIQSPEFLRTTSDGRRVEVVRLTTDGTRRYSVAAEVVAAYEYAKGRFTKVKEVEPVAE